jgi:hypothetical protein
MGDGGWGERVVMRREGCDGERGVVMGRGGVVMGRGRYDG